MIDRHAHLVLIDNLFERFEVTKDAYKLSGVITVEERHALRKARTALGTMQGVVEDLTAALESADIHADVEGVLSHISRLGL